MEEVLIPLGFFALCAYVVHATISGIVRVRQFARQSQVMTRLIETAGTTVTTSGFLESPAGRALLEAHSDRRSLAKQRVVTAVQTLIVFTVFGVTMFWARTRVTDEEQRFTFLLMAVLAVALGLALLLGAGVALALSRRWGLVRESDRLLPPGA